MRAKITNIVTHAPHLQPKPKPPENEKLGLGDAFAALAQPIAKTVDKVTGSKIATCRPCSERRAKWNAILPDILKPFRK